MQALGQKLSCEGKQASVGFWLSRCVSNQLNWFPTDLEGKSVQLERTIYSPIDRVLDSVCFLFLSVLYKMTGADQVPKFLATATNLNKLF